MAHEACQFGVGWTPDRASKQFDEYAHGVGVISVMMGAKNSRPYEFGMGRNEILHHKGVAGIDAPKNFFLARNQDCDAIVLQSRKKNDLEHEL
jgi:hypothetical protein